MSESESESDSSELLSLDDVELDLAEQVKNFKSGKPQLRSGTS